MKKFYSLALAAAVAMTASAGISATKVSQVSGEKVVTSTKKMQPVATKLSLSVANTLADGTDTSLAAVEGTYDFEWYSYLNSNKGWQKSVAEILIQDETTGAVTITLGGSFELDGTYDETTKVLTIPANQDLGYNEYNSMEVYLYHRKWTAEGQLEKDAKGNAIEFDDPFEFHFDGAVFACEEIEGAGDLEGVTFDNNIMAIGNNTVGWFIYGDNVTFAYQAPWEDEMPEGDWTSIGTGYFVDGWQMIGYYEMDYTSYDWEVEVEQNSIYPYIYRIAKPYQTKDCPIYQFNDDAEGTGYIVFSVADPEFVTVYPFIYSGFTNRLGAFLNTNFEGYYAIAGGFDKETIISELQLTDVSNYDEANGVVTFENCRFGTKTEPTKLYSWQNSEGNSLIGPSTLEIKLPHAGVDVISIDENAAKEYFNLQGMRVENPTNGLYIVRQGSKATKQLVK